MVDFSRRTRKQMNKDQETRKMNEAMKASVIVAIVTIFFMIVVGSCFPAEITATAADAVNVVYDDLKLLNDNGISTQFVRYLWNQSGDDRQMYESSVHLNAIVSHSQINFPPNTPGSPIEFLSNYLMRIDLAVLCPDPDDLKNAVEVWDRIENYKFAIIIEGVIDHGKTGGDKKGDDKSESESVRVFSAFPPHIDQEKGLQIQTWTNASNPVVWIPQFIYQATEEGERDGKGLYYDFRRIGKSPDPKISDFRFYVLSRTGMKIETVEDLNTDVRAAFTFSLVHGKERVVIAFNSPSRPVVNNGMWYITLDPFDENTDDSTYSAFANLLNHDYDGLEIIRELPNGLHEYTLFDRNGNLVEIAPPNLVADGLIPNPYTKELRPYVSCVRCHGEKESDAGMKPFTNIAESFFQSGLGIGILNDLSSKHPNKTTENIARLYSASLDKIVRNTQWDLSDAIVISTKGAKNSNGVPWTFFDYSRSLEESWASYRYTQVNAEIAIRESGFVVANDNPVETMRTLLGVPTSGLEDWRFVLLMLGKTISRDQWNLVSNDFEFRASQTQAQAADQQQGDGKNEKN